LLPFKDDTHNAFQYENETFNDGEPL